MSNHTRYTSLYYPTWEHIQKGCAVIARQVLEIDKSEMPAIMVAIGPDGFIPGVILSNIMEMPIFGVNYRSMKASHPMTDGVERKEVQIINGIKLNAEKMMEDKPSILLVDAIVNTGNTMDEMFTVYEEMGHKVYGASLYVREGGAFFPTMCWNRLHKDDPDVEFPWEI